MGLTTPSYENLIVQKPYGSQGQTEMAVALQEEDDSAITRYLIFLHMKYFFVHNLKSMEVSSTPFLENDT
jgi:hypothetical protein